VGDLIQCVVRDGGSQKAVYFNNVDQPSSPPASVAHCNWAPLEDMPGGVTRALARPRSSEPTVDWTGPRAFLGTSDVFG
jgi:hypothetical protein